MFIDICYRNDDGTESCTCGNTIIEVHRVAGELVVKMWAMTEGEPLRVTDVDAVNACLSRSKLHLSDGRMLRLCKYSVEV